MRVADLARAERQLRDEAVAELRRNVDADEVEVRRSADLRYAGQNYELEVALPDGDLDDDRWQELLARFEDEHERQYGFRLPGEAIELINLRVTALRREPPGSLAAAAGGAAEPRDAGGLVRRRRPGGLPDPTAAAISPRAPSSRARRSIEEPDSTTLVFAGDSLRVDPSGVLVLTIGAPAMTRTLELDSVGLHVLHNGLANIAAEMALVMMKTSYSTIFNEGPRLLDRPARPRRAT